MNKVFIKTRNQLLFAFSCFTFIGILIAVVSILFFSRIHDIYKVTSSLHMFYERYIKTVDAEQEFLSLDLGKSNFYQTGHSRYLEKHDESLTEMKSNLVALQKKKAFQDFDISTDIQKIDIEISKYETLFGFILDRIKVKGFRDYGLEGKMNEYVSQLEKMSKPIGLEHVLMLRRHEKDFLLRNDTVYILKLTAKVKELERLIWNHEKLSFGQKEMMAAYLQNYHRAFIELVNITKEIGYRDEKGLSDLLNQSKDNVENLFHSLYRKAEIREVVLVKGIQKSFVIIIVNLVLVSVFLIYLFTRKIKLPDTDKKDSLPSSDKNHSSAPPPPPAFQEWVTPVQNNYG